MARPQKFGYEPALRQKPSGIWEEVWRDRLTDGLQRRTTGERDADRARTILRQILTDVSPILAEARMRLGGAQDPIAACRNAGYRAAKAKERPEVKGSSSGIV